MYVGLWTRLHGFERDHLTTALECRSVVQGTLMRATIHLVSARDYWPLVAAIRSARRRHWLQELLRPVRRASRSRTQTELAQSRRPRQDHDGGHDRRVRGGRPGRQASLEQGPGVRVITVTKAGERKVTEARKVLDRVQEDVLRALAAPERGRLLGALNQLVSDRLSEPADCSSRPRRREPRPH